MTCKKCNSENVQTQIVQEMKIKNKKHGIMYWLFFGWLLDIFAWIIFTIPRLIIAIFRPKKSKIVTRTRTMAVCQNCGYQWKVK